MTDGSGELSLPHDESEAARVAAPVAATGGMSGRMRPERIEVVLAIDRRREHAPELRVRLVREMMSSQVPVSELSRREDICASVLHRCHRQARIASSDHYAEHLTEPDNLVSKGFLSDKDLVGRLDNTLKLSELDLDHYDAVHVAGGRGATFDLYPSDDVAKALEHFCAKEKVVGAICHGAIALGNVPDRIRGRRVTGYTLEGDQELQRIFGAGFVIPHYPQTVLEEVEPYMRAWDVIVDGRLVAGQNQQSASEYALALLHQMAGASPVTLV